MSEKKQTKAQATAPKGKRKNPQRQAVSLHKKGHSERAIAKKMGVSRSTVRHYLKRASEGMSSTQEGAKRTGKRARQWARWKALANKVNKNPRMQGGTRTYVSETWSQSEGRYNYSLYNK